MYTIIRGVRIDLTSAQIKKIVAAENKLKKCEANFERLLKHFGFTQITDLPKGHFENKEFDWYAEKRNMGNYNYYWMVGKGLKSDSFPGGWNYFTPFEIKEEILKAIDCYKKLKL
jgi:hypothetical protein